MTITCLYEQAGNNKLTGNIVLKVTNKDTKGHTVTIQENHYKTGKKVKTLAAGATVTIPVNLTASFHWYDVSVVLKGYENFEERFAGHVETGVVSKTDPLMGGVV